MAENIITDIKQTEEKARLIINEAKKKALATEKEAVARAEDLIKQSAAQAKDAAAANIKNKEAEAKKESEAIKQAGQEESSLLVSKVTPRLKAVAALIKDRVRDKTCQ